MDRKLFQDKFFGVIIGLAVGDALGVPIEGMSAQMIAENFGSVRDYRGGYGQTSDDTAMALCIIDGILQDGEIRAETIAEKFLHWFANDGRGIGFLTHRVLSYYSSGMEPLAASKKGWEESECKSAGNGAVMRCAPVALWHWNDLDRLIQNSVLTARLTHYDPRCTYGTVAINIAIALLLQGTTDRQTILAQILRMIAGHSQELEDEMRRLECQTLASLPLDGWDSGYTVLTTRAALLTMFEAENFQDGLVALINKGGDTDTNAAVAGALLGARWGLSAIPPRWIDQLEHRNQLMTIAEKFLALTEQHVAHF